MNTLHAPERARSGDRGQTLDWAGFVYTFLLATCSLMGHVSGLINYFIIAGVGLFLLMRFYLLPDLLVRALPLTLLPMMAIVSAIWSAYPDYSIYFGVQYLITVVAGLLIGFAVRGKASLLGLFLGFSLVQMLAFFSGLMSGQIAHALIERGSYLGFTGSKNAFGDMSALCALLALTMCVSRSSYRNSLTLIVALIVLAANLLQLYIANSTGAIVAFAVGALIILGFAIGTRLPTRGWRFVGIVALVLAAGLMSTSQLLAPKLLADVREVSGKGESLTGRTYIWERADVQNRKTPLFGVGYSAYWVVGNLEAEAIWRAMQITNRLGFNFHNTPLEIRVHLGLIGLILYAFVTIPYAFMGFVRTYRAPDPVGFFFCALCGYEGARLSFESIAVWSFNYSTILVFAALAWSVHPDVRAPMMRARAMVGDRLAPRRPVLRSAPTRHSA